MFEIDKFESDTCDGRPCSLKAFQAERVGELGVSEARRVWIRRFGAKEAALGGLESR